ncbi:hypothetical protein [Streptacidiphilus rugosus]|uniref:hypothetical protein n=1 Tax=Streptacidiphilus rugosus TaxID=405783 RepID=UPI0012F991F0|nr:hypothetical protein [Streptacidiphilus rugosus]
MPYNAQQPQHVVVDHYYSAPARRGPDVRQVLGWTAVGGIVTAALLAVATVAVALGLAALALALSIMALVAGDCGGTSAARAEQARAPRRAPYWPGPHTEAVGKEALPCPSLRVHTPSRSDRSSTSAAADEDSRILRGAPSSWP